MVPLRAQLQESYRGRVRHRLRLEQMESCVRVPVAASRQPKAALPAAVRRCVLRARLCVALWTCLCPLDASGA